MIRINSQSGKGGIAYVELDADGHKLFSVGRHRNITAASLSAVVSSVNRLMEERG